ncbi:integral membrane protein- variant [Apiospora saccharicola]|uniref:Integral membrane protein- variant n=1 Tax=Apiospora saccharicola TaxID=335842 RepID=A0ABR1W229_9PEZI
MTSSLQPRSAARGGPPKWDRSIPPHMRPLVRAYALGYASAVVPRLFTLVLQQVTTRKKSRSGPDNGALQPPRESPVVSLQRILRAGLDPQRFPAFCATLVGGSTLLEILLRRLCSRIPGSLSAAARRRLSRWLASFTAACFSLKLLQSKASQGFAETVPAEKDSNLDIAPATIKYAGKTLDLSIFAFCRALDVIVGELWAQRRTRRVADKQWTSIEAAASSLADPSMFAVSCALIMWSWFYYPSRLPRAYNKWISSAASVDKRLIEALQRCRTNELRYGEDTGQAPLIQGMCRDYKWPLQWGDPAVAIPFPCEVVHMGCGPSCEYHALSRFGRSFRWSMFTYLPLNLLLVARKPSFRKLKYAVLSAARSSAFLGAFITLFYYGVCLARTRVGPHLLGKDAAARDRIDGGFCVGTGCFACGWSILIENPGRRKDMALFVAPRALATLLPRRYPLDKQWRETLVFAASTAVVFTCALENPERVRGVFGKVLNTVLKP